MSTSTYEIPGAVTTVTTLSTTTYQDHTITVEAIRRQQAEYTSTGTYRDGETWSSFHPATDYTKVVGRISGYRNAVSVDGAKHADPVAVLKACHKVIDQDAYDDEIRADVTGLIHAVSRADFTGVDAKLVVGDVAYVYAMGFWRRGRVTKVSPKGKATVSYTTASSDGRIFHKCSHDVAVVA